MIPSLSWRPIPPAIGLALLLSGCVVGPNYVAKTPVVRSALAGADPAPVVAPLSRPVSRDADVAAWWKQLGDSQLDALIARALAGNLDRETAASRVREARQAFVETRAALLPTLSGKATVSHTRISDNAGLSSIGSFFGGPGDRNTNTTGFPGLEFDSYELGLSASWDVDLFGGKRRADQAAARRLEAQVWTARDTDVAVSAEVTRVYLQLRADQLRLRLMDEENQTRASLISLVGVRSRRGLVSESGLVAERNQLAIAEAERAPLQASIEAGMHQLAIVLGSEPDALSAELSGSPAVLLPAVPPEVPIGLPSALLQRRPDIRAAERELAASVADVGQATAALYPSISLTGSLSLLSSQLSNLIQWDSRNYNGVAQLTAPLFDAGRFRAAKGQYQERSVQAEIAYRRSVLKALGQVEDSLSSFEAEQRRLLDVARARDEAKRSAALDQTRYRNGLVDLRTPLLTKLALQHADLQVVETRASEVAPILWTGIGLG